MSAETTAPDPATAPLERPRAEADWSAFVDAYGRTALAWFAQTGLPADDIRAIVRTLFVFLYKEFSDVIRESSLRFRTWLQYAAHISWSRTVEVLVAERREESSGPLVTLLLSVEAHDSLLHALDAECSRQRRRELLIRMQSLCSESDWACFYAIVLEGRPLADVASERGWRHYLVQAAVQRVHRQLLDDLRALEEKF